MKNRLLVGLTALLCTFLLGGCIAPVTCPPSYLTNPILVDPADFSVVSSLNPTLSWNFPKVVYPISSKVTGTCIPEKYSVVLTKGPFNNNNYGSVVAGDVKNFTPGVSLEPGRTYHWIVWPKSGDTFGPASVQRTFFTGETCAAADLVAPQPASPYNGEDVADLQPSLMWEYPDDCRPESYRIDLSIEPMFTDTSLAGATGNSDTRWAPGSPLSDCTRYYWKITPYTDTTAGPFSSTFTFRVNMGGCGPDTGIPGSTINGKVWEDLCSAPDSGPAPVPFPAGCVLTVGGVIKANGIKDPGEPGISNVLVRLGTSPCPSTDKGVTFTDENGDFSFDGIPGGDYCVSIDASENADVLLPGQWTHPVPSAPSAAGNFMNITVPDGDTLNDNDFGWRYRSSRATSYAYLSGILWNDLCPDTAEYFAGIPASSCVKTYWSHVYADGIRQITEKGIADATIKAFTGSCGTSSPLTLLSAAKTDVKGAYHFMLPLVGSWTDYCISVNAEGAENVPILLPGVWSFDQLPFPNKDNWENYLIYGGESITRNWGWDYLESPLQPTITPTSVKPKFPELDLPKHTYCYTGPSFNEKAFVELPEFSHFSILGIDPTGLWYLVDPDEKYTPPTDPNATPTPVNFVRCWIPKRDAETSGDLNGLPVFSGRSTPTPTPTVTPRPSTSTNCSSYKTRGDCKKPCIWGPPVTGGPSYCHK